MITKNDAINIATSIAKSSKIEIDQCNDITCVHVIRGAAFRALNDIWYGILTLHVREQFRVEGSDILSRENFLNIASEILDK